MPASLRNSFLLSPSRWNPRWFLCKGQRTVRLRREHQSSSWTPRPSQHTNEMNTHRLLITLLLRAVRPLIGFFARVCCKHRFPVCPACFQSLSKPRGFFTCFNLHCLLTDWVHYYAGYFGCWVVGELVMVRVLESFSSQEPGCMQVRDCRPDRGKEQPAGHRCAMASAARAGLHRRAMASEREREEGGR